MKQNDNFSVLPFYDSLQKQHHLKDYAYGKKYALMCDISILLPFQIVIPHKTTNVIQSVSIISDRGVTATTQMIDAGLTIKQFANYDIIIFPAQFVLNNLELSPGFHHIELRDDYNTYYSEWFNVVLNVAESYLELKYWNLEDLPTSDGHISYADGFKNKVYLDTQVGKPDYPFTEVATKRDGHTYIEKQLSEKKYKFNFLAPEYLCDALRVVRMHDFIQIKSKGMVYEVETILITPKWLDQGDLASVNVEFECNTVVKKIGTLINYSEGADYGDDYGDDYDTNTNNI